MNRRELGVLNELALLRETVARERNVPLKYVLPDDVLAGIVSLRPTSVEELSQLRRLDAGMRKHIGARIIGAVATGEAIPEDDLPPRAPRPLGAQRDAIVAAIALFVNSVAAANDIPSALLVSRNEIERVARELPQSEEALAKLLDLTPWRRDVVVAPLWQFLGGERVLRIDGYREGTPRTAWEAILTGADGRVGAALGGEGRSM
jgi:ribonuclease D